MSRRCRSRAPDKQLRDRHHERVNGHPRSPAWEWLCSLSKFAAGAAAIGVTSTIYSHLESGPSRWSSDAKEGAAIAVVLFLLAAVVVPFTATVERRRAPDGHEHHELLRGSAARTGMVLWVVLAPVALGMALVYDPNTPMVLRAVLAVASVAVVVAGGRFAVRAGGGRPRGGDPRLGERRARTERRGLSRGRVARRARW